MGMISQHLLLRDWNFNVYYQDFVFIGEESEILNIE